MKNHTLFPEGPESKGGGRLDISDNSRKNHAERWSWIVSSLVVISMGVALLAWVTSRGVVVARDSLGYFAGVEAWQIGGGLSTVHWPPGYPLLLVLARAAEWGPVRAATTINLVAYATSGLLAAMLMRAIVGPRVVMGVGGLALVMGASVVLDSYRFALSEPVFLVSQIAACLLTVDYIRNGRTWSLACASVIVGGSTWLRYAGAFTILPVVLASWFRTEIDSRTRCAHSALSAAAAMSVVGALVVVLSLSNTETSTREIMWHPMTLGHVQQLGCTVLGWGIPSRWLSASPLLGICGGIAAILTPPIAAYLLRGRHGVASWFAAQAALYLIGLMASICMADHATPLDARILLPFYVAIVSCGISLCAGITSRRAASVVAVLVVAFGIVCSARSLRYMSTRRLAEDGYDSPSWRADPIVSLVRALPKEWTVIGNPTGVMEFHAKRPVYAFPQRYDTVRALDFDGIDSLLKCVKSRDPDKTLLVYYPDEGDARDESRADVARALGLGMQTNIGRAVLYTRSGLPVKCAEAE
jgi:hypothetical protein